jgi:hypothetical protein
MFVVLILCEGISLFSVINTSCHIPYLLLYSVYIIFCYKPCRLIEKYFHALVCNMYVYCTALDYHAIDSVYIQWNLLGKYLVYYILLDSKYSSCCPRPGLWIPYVHIPLRLIISTDFVSSSRYSPS